MLPEPGWIRWCGKQQLIRRQPYGGAYGSGPGAGDPFGAGGPFGGFMAAIPTIMQAAVRRMTIQRCVQQAISSATATTMRR